MNEKERYLERLKWMNLEQQELERKWRLHLEEREMFEAARRYINSINNPQAAGGGKAVNTNIYAFNTNDYTLYNIGQDSSTTPFSTQTTFVGQTVFELNPDDGLLYYVSYDSGLSQMVFGTVDITSRVVTEIDRTNLTGISVNTPGGLTYVGDGHFIYVSNFIFGGGYPVVIQINTDGSATLLTEPNTNPFLTGIFKVGDTSYSSFSNFPFAGLGVYDYSNDTYGPYNDVTLIGAPNVLASKVWMLWGVISANDKVYGIIQAIDKVSDPNIFIQCVAEINLETYEATYLYSLDTNYLYTDLVSF